MALEDIIQRVVISGQDDIGSAFESIGKAGEEAFKAIADAAHGTQFGEMAEGLAVLVGAIAAVSAALFAWTEHASDAVFEMGHLADQAGTTIEEMSGLKIALGTLGVDTDSLGTSFKRLAVNINKNWEDIRKDIRDGASKIAEDYIKIDAAQTNAAEAQLRLSRASREAATQQIHDAESVKGASLSLESAENRLRALRGNPVSESERKALELKEAELAVEKAQQAEIDAKRKKADDAADATIKQQKLIQEAEKTRLEVIAAQNKLLDDQQKDIGKIAESINGGLVRGMNLAKVSASDMVKAIEAAASTNGLPPSVIDTFLKASDVFKGLTSESQKMAIAVQLFGRGVTQELVAAMSKGSASIEQLKQAAIDAGLAFSDADEKIAGKFHQSLAALGQVASSVSTQLGLLFAPSFTAGIDEITAFLKRNRETILDWGRAFIDAVRGAADILGTMAHGVSVAIDGISHLFGGEAISAAQKFAFVIGAVGAALTLVLSPIIAWPILIGAVALAIGALFEKLGGWDGVKAAWESFSNWVLSTWVGSIVKALETLFGWIGKIAQAFSSTVASGTSAGVAGAGGGAAEGKAAGGPIVGPGSGTSDSVPIFASNGEFMMKAQAVSKYGLQFMHAVNQGLVDGFAMGGLIGSPVRMAGGGAVPSTSVLNLTIDGQSFKGLRASEDTAKSLHRFAISRQLSTTGRKPSWVK